MIMRIISFYLMVLMSCFAFIVKGQIKPVDYHRDIKPILQKHCISCHYKDGPAPFSLESYTDAAKRSKFIAHVTNSGYMPPWKADVSFRTFRNQRILSDVEKDMLRRWVDQPFNERLSREKVKKTSEPVVKNKADLHITMKNKYAIPTNNKDDFRFFHLPANILNDTYLTGLQFVPGNTSRVHHSRIMVDTTGLMAGIDGLSETDPAVYNFQKHPLADEFLYGWVPGNYTFRFPVGFGKKLIKGSSFILNMHYAPSSLQEVDQSGVHLYFAKPKEVLREVKTMILRENDITNKPFYLPAGTKPMFYLTSGLIQNDISLITVQPHAHLLGKSFRAFAISQEGDMIPLIKIDNWDFDWQTTYEFDKLIHIPAGSIIIMETQYDNTAENPRNPHNPPKDVTYGWRTVDEMMNLIMYYVDYKPGDETKILSYPD
jgi:hypothetical protein